MAQTEMDLRIELNEQLLKLIEQSRKGEIGISDYLTKLDTIIVYGMTEQLNHDSEWCSQ